MKKEVIEKACIAAGIMPARRETIGGCGVYVADGFSSMPELAFKRFGAEPGEFPFGAFLTIWFVERKQGEFDIGAPMFFDAFHNKEYDTETKKLARVNTAIREAHGFIKRRERIEKNGV